MPEVRPLDWLLHPPAGRSASDVLRAGIDLSPVTLDAMRREALVVHVAGGVYLPRDLADVPGLRRAALRTLVPRGRVVGLLAAAWAKGIDTDPNPVEVLVERSAPFRRPVDGVRERQSPLPPSDVHEVDGLRLTTPARTAADIARWLDPDRARPAVAALLAAGTTADDVLAVLDRGRYRNAVRGRALISELSPAEAPRRR